MPSRVNKTTRPDARVKKQHQLDHKKRSKTRYADPHYSEI